MSHKIKSVRVLSDYFLSVQFAEGVTKIYDLKPLFEKRKMFNELKNNQELLYSVEVDAGGYGIVWNDDIDLSCYEIYENGEFTEEIFAELINEGYRGDKLIEEAKYRQLKVRPAVEKMLSDVNKMVTGEIESMSYKEVFDEKKY